MINESTEKVIREQKSKLMLAESIDEIKDIVTKAGGEISDEIAGKLFAEIKANNAASGTEIDDDEMDAVAGGEWNLCDECFNFNWCSGEWYCYLTQH